MNNAINTHNGTNSTQNIHLESVSGEVMLQNQANMNIRVVLYNIIARRSLDSQTAITWGPWAPTQAWGMGEQDTGVNVGNNPYLGCTPFQ